MLLKKIADIMTKNVIKVNKSERLSYAIEIMEKNKISRLIVVDDKDNIVGILTEKDIMDRLGAARTRRLPPSRLSVSSVMSEDIYTITADTSILDAINLMVDKRIGTLPVVENSKLIGLVTKSNIISLFKDYLEPTAKEILDELVKKITPDYRLIAARQVMLEGDLEYLIVVLDDKPLGVITEKDIARAYTRLRFNENIRHLGEILNRIYVRDILVPIKAITIDTTLGKTIRLLLNKKLKAVPVVDNSGKLIGGISRSGIIKAVAAGKIKLPE